jgi:BA14K-like protein
MGNNVGQNPWARVKETEMTRFLKSAILSAAVAATTLTAIPAANAGDGWRHYNHYYNGHSTGDVVAAGVLGLAAGALIAGIASQPAYREPVYADSYRYQRVRPAGNYYGNGYYDEPVYARGSLEPWSREWYRYCRNRYRSFDPGSGTFVGYDGREHFCTVY